MGSRFSLWTLLHLCLFEAGFALHFNKFSNSRVPKNMSPTVHNTFGLQVANKLLFWAWTSFSDVMNPRMSSIGDNIMYSLWWIWCSNVWEKYFISCIESLLKIVIFDLLLLVFNKFANKLINLEKKQVYTDACMHLIALLNSCKMKLPMAIKW